MKKKEKKKWQKPRIEEMKIEGNINLSCGKDGAYNECVGPGYRGGDKELFACWWEDLWS